MEERMNGFCRELIIHPGETLQEVIEDRGMTRRELAARTGVSDKHISTVINGSKSISVSFAKKLEYALGIESSFWINLQSIYDRELLEFEELNQISKEERDIVTKDLKEIIDHWNQIQIISNSSNTTDQVLEMRKLLGISNLADIPELAMVASFRAQTSNRVNPYVLYAWQRMCELQTKDIVINNTLDLKKLESKISQIKKTMLINTNEIQEQLKSIFAECGIVFKIVKHFVGAPVQGFLSTDMQGKTILCMTIRQKFADIFWFTLFHEIGHILNGDTKARFTDFESVDSRVERAADSFARDALLDNNEYAKFRDSGKFDLASIEKFAEKQLVKPFIVIGRLMKEDYIGWESGLSGQRIRYEWN